MVRRKKGITQNSRCPAISAGQRCIESSSDSTPVTTSNSLVIEIVITVGIVVVVIRGDCIDSRVKAISFVVGPSRSK